MEVEEAEEEEEEQAEGFVCLEIYRALSGSCRALRRVLGLKLSADGRKGLSGLGEKKAGACQVPEGEANLGILGYAARGYPGPPALNRKPFP